MAEFGEGLRQHEMTGQARRHDHGDLAARCGRQAEDHHPDESREGIARSDVGLAGDAAAQLVVGDPGVDQDADEHRREHMAEGRHEDRGRAAEPALRRTEPPDQERQDPQSPRRGDDERADEEHEQRLGAEVLRVRARLQDQPGRDAVRLCEDDDHAGNQDGGVAGGEVVAPQHGPQRRAAGPYSSEALRSSTTGTQVAHEAAGRVIRQRGRGAHPRCPATVRPEAARPGPGPC